MGDVTPKYSNFLLKRMLYTYFNKILEISQLISFMLPKLYDQENLTFAFKVYIVRSPNGHILGVIIFMFPCLCLLHQKNKLLILMFMVTL